MMHRASQRAQPVAHGKKGLHAWACRRADSPDEGLFLYTFPGSNRGVATPRPQKRPREAVRLRKVVVTEPVTKTVPVQREEIRVEREPITDQNRGAAMSGPALREGEHTEVLNEEEVVAEKAVEPKERVRLDKDVSVEEERVEEQLRKERIDVERERRNR